MKAVFWVTVIEFIVENDNPEKITTYSNMDTFEFSVSKSMLEDKLSQQ